MGETVRHVELESDIIKAYAETFFSRWDLYPMQIDDGSYVCQKITTIDRLVEHTCANMFLF